MSGSKNLQAAIPASPIVVDAPNGDVRVEWRRFFLQLWNRTGGSQGALPGVGTITGVTAGAGLSGGGTSGTVTLTLTIPVSIADGGTGATTAPAALTNLGAYAASNPAGYQTAAQVTTSLTPYAPLASPTFTGTPTLPTGSVAVTQTAGNNSTKIATTAYVDSINTMGWG